MAHRMRRRRSRHTSVSPEFADELVERDSRIVTYGWIIRHPDSRYSEEIQEYYDAGFDGTGITIAILDSGVDPDHPMLVGRVRGLTPDDLIDNFGHGSGMASIAAGAQWQDPDSQWLNSNGAVIHQGVAPGANILSVKILNDEGTGSEYAMGQGIIDAARAGSDIISISAGIVSKMPCSGTRCWVCHGLNAAKHRGVIVFAATGNEGPDFGTMACPARHKYAVSVGAETINGDLAIFSGRAHTGWDGDVLAPGGGDELVDDPEDVRREWVVAAAPPGSELQRDFSGIGDELQLMQGSSPSTAFAAGKAALDLQSELTVTPNRKRAAKIVRRRFKEFE